MSLLLHAETLAAARALDGAECGFVLLDGEIYLAERCAVDHTWTFAMVSEPPAPGAPYVRRASGVELRAVTA